MLIYRGENKRGGLAGIVYLLWGYKNLLFFGFTDENFGRVDMFSPFHI